MPVSPVQDLSALSTDFVVDPYPVYARLREQGPVHRVRTTASGEFWLVVGHEEARAALTDPRLSNDIRHSAAWEADGGNAIGLNMVQTDPPDHTRLRGRVARAFTPGRIEALRPRIQGIAQELLDAMVPPGRADLVEGFALPLPLAVICELLGVPATDRKAFHDWYLESTDRTRPEAAGAAAQAMAGYLAELIEAKRHSPGDDLLSALVRAMDDDGDPLSAQEMLGMAFVLLVAGYETSANLISSGALALLRHPEQLAALRADWSLLPGAIEEMLRYDGPVESAAFRFTREPVEIAGPASRRGSPSRSSSAPDRVTRGASPSPTASTSGASRAAISPSDTVSTTVWAPRWPGSKGPSPSGPCWSAAPTSRWTPIRPNWSGAPA